MPDTEPVLTRFTLTVTPSGKCYNHPHSIEKETETQRLNNLCAQKAGGDFNSGTQEVQSLYSVTGGHGKHVVFPAPRTAPGTK